MECGEKPFNNMWWEVAIQAALTKNYHNVDQAGYVLEKLKVTGYLRDPEADTNIHHPQCNK